jgi:GNAT superfamily N-acetyltransferase
MTAAAVTIRPAVRADLPDIVRLVRGLAVYEKLEREFTANKDAFDRLLFAPDHPAEAILAVAPRQGPVGIALYYRTVNTFRGGTGLFLEDLFVEPAHRGNGIGRALLRHLAATALAEGASVDG